MGRTGRPREPPLPPGKYRRLDGSGIMLLDANGKEATVPVDAETANGKEATVPGAPLSAVGTASEPGSSEQPVDMTLDSENSADLQVNEVITLSEASDEAAAAVPAVTAVGSQGASNNSNGSDESGKQWNKAYDRNRYCLTDGC